jgi:hypothetical protein
LFSGAADPFGQGIAVMIDRKPERRLRPRELVKLLSARQKRPLRVNEQKLLETPFDAYCYVAGSNKSDWTPDAVGVEPVVSLVAIHELLRFFRALSATIRKKNSPAMSIFSTHEGRSAPCLTGFNGDKEQRPTFDDY